MCPGTYVEQVQITGSGHDGLKLESTTPLGATIQWPTTPSVNHQLVNVNGADHVAIRKFIISGPFPSTGCSVDRYEGVRYEDAFDGSSNTTTSLSFVTAIPLSGAASKEMLSRLANGFPPRPPASPGGARIEHNVIDKYQKNGVQAVNTGTDADVRHNTITASTDQPALQASIASNGSLCSVRRPNVEKNIVSGNKFTPTPLSTGIILDEAPSGSSEVEHNRIFDNDYGIETDTQMGLEIDHNDVFGNIADGITLCGDMTQGCGPAQQNVVRKNDITDNGGSGIVLFGASSNLLKSNHIEDNGTAAGDTTDGILIDMNSMDNQILR